MSLMPIQPKIVIEVTLKVGVVYKFDAPELINTDIPHYFIVVGIENDNNYMVLCTTQLDAKLAYFTNKRYDPNTLAFILPTTSNGLKVKTYVNCNDYHTISKSELIKKVELNKFQLIGNLSKEEYEKIKFAIDLSYVNDIPTFLLQYPED